MGRETFKKRCKSIINDPNSLVCIQSNDRVKIRVDNNQDAVLFNTNQMSSKGKLIHIPITILPKRVNKK